MVGDESGRLNRPEPKRVVSEQGDVGAKGANLTGPRAWGTFLEDE